MVSFAESNALSLHLGNLTALADFHSSKQHIQLFKHPTLGRVLAINGELQHVEACHDLYHEPLVHLPASFLPSINSCLIIGGGSLYAAREALRYRSLRRLVLVDHDPEVLELMLQNYGHAKSVVADPRFVYRKSDGLDYLFSSDDRFDLVINDCFDLREISSCHRSNMYKALTRHMSPGGICSDVTYRNVFEESISSIATLIGECSNRIAAGLITIPEYPGALHIHTIWGDAVDVGSQVRNGELQEREGWAKELGYFDPNNRAHFHYLPPRLRNWLSK